MPQAPAATTRESGGPTPAVEVSCLICGTEESEILCPASEVILHREYLRRFHVRRLRPSSDGRVPMSELADRAEFSQDDATDIVSCLSCGLVYRNPRPSEEAVTRTYMEDQYGNERLEGVHRAHLDIFRAKATTFGRWLTRKKHPQIVEVGSFVGGFLAAGQQRGWDMLGVDPGEEVTDFCRKRRLPVHRGTLEDADLAPRSVDAVAIWNTFDQLPDPHPTLDMVRAILRPDGILVVRIPNGACFQWAEPWMRRLPQPFDRWLRAAMAWNNLLAFPYLYGYSLPTLDRLMARYGMQRSAVYPDTLVRLSDHHTKWWASQEERFIKTVWRAIARLENRGTGGTARLAPWIDVYYRFTNGHG